MSQAIHRFVERLAATATGPDLANPYAMEDPALDRPGAALIRRKNLETYLGRFTAHPPRFIFVGEAPGYRGCRFSGVVFTSEYTLATHAFFKDLGCQPSSNREKPWREASASIVWETIGQLDRIPLLWATVPFHPHEHGEPLTNRAPTRAEQQAGLPFFFELRAFFPQAKIIAAGRVASETLGNAGVPLISVRHPSHGGKAEFQAGVLKAARNHKP